ncbi:PD-(D/E)XK motif protein [Actinacidiphila soli]|uniref:PD-(D/E)XK motif protein n=1 Tax=Actinacidiphila soli TaxID=2487275 RepID=UPI000FCA326F|nr:PD-(D/E)XK motif protein [Actinacidiphila soli]
MTEGAEAQKTHLAWSDVEYYLHSGQDATIPLGSVGQLRIDYVVAHEDIALHVETGPHQRTLRTTIPAIGIDQIHEGGRRMTRLRTTEPALLRDFHDLLCAITERMVVNHRSLEQAFMETVRAWSALLDGPRSLQLEIRLGLIGELAVLRSVAAQPDYDWSTALEAWVGPEGEEHDFALPLFDLEVKTTASEQRRHTIHGTGQLSPTTGRPLWLVSLQLTRGGSAGRTLSQCVAAVREQLAEHAPAHVARFLARVARAGWRAELPDDERWSLRSEPLVLAVDGSLPRLDETMLSALPGELRARLADVRYRIDVTGLPAADTAPIALSDIQLP